MRTATIFLFLIPFCYSDDEITASLSYDKSSIRTNNYTYAIAKVSCSVIYLQDKSNAYRKNGQEMKLSSLIESSIIESGLKLLYRDKLDMILKKQALASAGITESSAIQIGKLVPANRLIFSNLINQGTLHPGMLVDVQIKAIDTETGEIVWKSDIRISNRTKETKVFYSEYNKKMEAALKLLFSKLKPLHI